MLPSPVFRPLLAIAVALVGGDPSARERAPRAPQALAHAERLANARVAERAPTSLEVLTERLALLGMTETDAIWLASEAGTLTAAEIVARVAETGLTGPHAEKALQLVLALQQGRPIAHVGVDPEQAIVEAAWDLTTQGADPDAAAWSLARPEATVEIDALPARVDTPSPAIATCKTCPQVDVILSPTTTRQVHRSSVEGSGCVMYRFTVQPGRTYRFSTCTADGGSAAFDTLFTTWTTQCVPGPTSNDACGTGSRIDVTPTVAGYVFVRVSAVSGSGAFGLSYQDLGPLCRTCPAYDRIITSIPAAGGSLTDSVPENGCRTYRFSVLGNRVYRFTTCPASLGSLDTVIETFTSNCSPGPGNDDACTNNGSEVVVSSPTSSVLFVRVRGFAGAAGSFTLRYSDATGECHACPTFQATTTEPAFTYRSYPGVLLPGQCYTYRVPMAAANFYRISTCTGVDGSASFTSEVEVRQPDCSFGAGASGSCGSGAELLYPAAVTGDHFVTVRDVGGVGGAYTLVLGVLVAPCGYTDPPALVPTTSYQVRTGELEEPFHAVRYAMALDNFRIYRISFCDGSGGFGTNKTATWASANCTVLAFGPVDGNNAPAPTVTPSCSLATSTIFNGAARAVQVGVNDLFATYGAYGIGYREVPCNEAWQISIASDPAPGAGASYAGLTLVAGTFMQLRVVVTPGANYQFSLCPGDGGSASFNGRLEMFRTSACSSLPATRVFCGDDESIAFNSSSESAVILRVIDEGGAGGTFDLNLRRMP